MSNFQIFIAYIIILYCLCLSIPMRTRMLKNQTHTTLSSIIWINCFDSKQIAMIAKKPLLAQISFEVLQKKCIIIQSIQRSLSCTFAQMY